VTGECNGSKGGSENPLNPPFSKGVTLIGAFKRVENPLFFFPLSKQNI
jgi:hypothetical protein